jgi:hypothetical protein
MLAGTALLSAAATAAADSKPTHPAPVASAPGPGKTAPSAAAPAAATKLQGYVVLSSPELVAPNGQQVRGVVACPAGLVPLGGGAFVASPSTRANLNSSFPRDNGWAADVNNASGADTTFHVTVVCAVAPKSYTVVEGTQVPNPVGQQSSATATCPRGTKPLGGGGLSNLGLLFTNLNSDFPDGRRWRVDENNASATAGGVTAFAVCGHVRGWQLVGEPFSVAANSQAAGGAACPAPKVPLGGGVLSSSTSVGVNINSTVPQAAPFNEWAAWMNNASGVDTAAATFVVCAS